jgi:hypothetical protein
MADVLRSFRTMNAYDNQVALQVEYDETCRTVIELLDELNVVEILRIHMPPARWHLVDRLENALRLIDRITNELDSELEYFLDDEE